MTVDITHDCIWILNADKHLCILQSKHLQCSLNSETNTLANTVNNFLRKFLVEAYIPFFLCKGSKRGAEVNLAAARTPSFYSKGV